MTTTGGDLRRTRRDVQQILDDITKRGPLSAASTAEFAEILAQLEDANALIEALLDQYDTGDATTAKFWTSVIVGLAGFAALDVSNDWSILGALAAALHAAWSGRDLFNDIYNEYIDLGLLHEVSIHIDAVESEMIRRGL